VNLVCSFCGKAPGAMSKLISGPGVFICNECVDLCVKILEGEAGDRAAPGAPVAASNAARKSCDVIRAQPNLYIGETHDGRGILRMFQEVLQNAAEEAHAGSCDRILVTLHRDASITVDDNGRGIPVETHPGFGRTTAEVVMTVLHAQALKAPPVRGPRTRSWGVGLAVVNALSEEVRLQVRREGVLYEQEFRRGEPVTPLRAVGAAATSGTRITFKPDASVVQGPPLSPAVIAEELRQVGEAVGGSLRMSFMDERSGASLVFPKSAETRSWVSRVLGILSEAGGLPKSVVAALSEADPAASTIIISVKDVARTCSLLEDSGLGGGIVREMTLEERQVVVLRWTSGNVVVLIMQQ
jgi:ClpX C4-type zinc finger protein/histidine kinase/DNA gyrase B/HSP90-like ATPase